MFAMTGHPAHAREFLRLAFPDAQGQKELEEIDGELVENKADPLSGSYHYGAHLMILLWDLIEESPVFTDEERLRVTRAFARQLDNRLAYLGGKREVDAHRVYHCAEPAPWIGTRHNIYHALCLFCLARYFQRYYPDPVWEQALRGARNYFGQLRTPRPFVRGEAGTPQWHCTCIEPLLTYVLLSGDRTPVESGALASLLREQEVLLSGRVPDPMLESASLSFLHKAAHLMRDGRYVAYREGLGMNTDIFRLGQSFWPEPGLKPAPPHDLVGKWTVGRLSPGEWRSRHSGLAEEESFSWASFRSTTDGSGDYLLVNGRNALGRHPYFALAINELRLAGKTLLHGIRNQLQTNADGLFENQVALDAAIERSDVLGTTVRLVAEVPRSAHCHWRRMLLQRIGRYALVVDDLTYRVTSDHFETRFMWQTLNHQWRASPSGYLMLVPESQPAPDTGLAELHGADVLSASVWSPSTSTWEPGGYTLQEWRGRVEADRRQIFFWLLTLPPERPETPRQCLRLTENAAVLALPERAVVVVHEYGGIAGSMVVVAEDHLAGCAVRQVRVSDALGAEAVLLSSDVPVDVDWDFATGRLHVTGPSNARVTILREGPGAAVLTLTADRLVLEDAYPPAKLLARLRVRLGDYLDRGRALRAKPPPQVSSVAPAKSPAKVSRSGPDPLLERQVHGLIIDTRVIPMGETAAVAVAAADQIRVFTARGQPMRSLRADGRIRMLHWWDEPRLLLAGCADGQVVAFDREGRRKWTFVSEMDPAVTRAGKPYWFNTAPGHEGVHGLGSGVFLEGRSQAFVGSACTLEIIDENGRLVKRLPQFWGTVHTFAIVPAPDGSLDLLAGRRIADVADLAIINNRTLDPTRRGYQDVPPGTTQVDVWGNETSHHIFVEDVDGDGQLEIIRESTGVWNRVTVWGLGGSPVGCVNYLNDIDFCRVPQEGAPKYNVHFGPGVAPSLGINNAEIREFDETLIRDLAVADLQGTGCKQILVALASGWIMAFDGRCQRMWSQRLTEVPTVLRPVGRLLVVGTEQGGVHGLRDGGARVFSAEVKGRVTGLEEVAGNLWVTTAEGTIRVFGPVER